MLEFDSVKENRNMSRVTEKNKAVREREMDEYAPVESLILRYAGRNTGQQKDA